MARTAKATNTEPAVDAAATEEPVVAADVTAENMNEKIEEVEEKKSPGRPKKVKEQKVDEEPLEDSDEIEVVSLIPNVVYEDERTGNYYEWEKIGHCEDMTFDEIKNMHRKYKAYFNDMWLKPLDERVIKKLNLARNYEKYDYLMDEKNYTAKNIDEVLDGISSVSNGLKISIITRLKDMVAEGLISDIKVIKKLEDRLDIELISFL